MSIHRLAVAELISVACGNAFCAEIVARSIMPFHKGGTLHFITEDLIEKHGREVFEDAHWLCDLMAETEALGL